VYQLSYTSASLVALNVDILVSGGDQRKLFKCESENRPN